MFGRAGPRLLGASLKLASVYLNVRQPLSMSPSIQPHRVIVIFNLLSMPYMTEMATKVCYKEARPDTFRRLKPRSSHRSTRLTQLALP